MLMENSLILVHLTFFMSSLRTTHSYISCSSKSSYCVFSVYI